jgi:hypothetical protein
MNTTPRSLVGTAALAVALFCPGSAGAWSANGHSTVGQIAQDLLERGAQQGDPDSRTAIGGIQALLGAGFSLAALAPCADQIRAVDEETGAARTEGSVVSCGGLQLTVDPKSEPWHFVNIPITAPASAASVSASCANNCVVSQIKSNLQLIQNQATAVADKKVALMFLVHFVGDVHQPLHCATEIENGVSDRGGNSKNVKLDNTTLNLHALWDHEINETDATNNPASLSKTLEGSLPADTSAWTQGDFVTQAAIESFGKAQSVIYPSYHQAAAKSAVPLFAAPYQEQMQPIVQQRLQMAGVRLAALLKQAFAAAPAATQPPSSQAAESLGKVKNNIASVEAKLPE